MLLGLGLIELLYFIIPAAALIFLVTSIFRFIKAKKASPGSFSTEEIKTRRLLLIISSVIFGILMAVVAGFIILISMAVAFM